jgi:dihydrodipicolinate reductase
MNGASTTLTRRSGLGQSFVIDNRPGGGDNIGEHHVIFAGMGERLELVHRATNRAIYAKGAVRAARWLVGRPPGLYGMKEVLGL